VRRGKRRRRGRKRREGYLQLERASLRYQPLL